MLTTFPPLTRRSFMRLSALSVAGLALPLTFDGAHSEDDLQSLPPLREIAANKGILYGAAVEPLYLKDPDFAEAFIKDCSILVPEWSLKWKALNPTEQEWHCEDADALVNFATAHDMKMRGHTLVWYSALPDWALDKLKSGAGEPFLESYIQTVAGRYRGKIHSWDVVNEAIEPKDNLPNGLRASPWLTAFGPDYIERAFRLTAAVDPDAQRVYNDYAVEDDPVKAEAMLNLLRRLKDRDTPIQAVGLQAHLITDKDLAPLDNLCRAIKDMDLDLIITEMDVQERNYLYSLEKQDQRIADKANAFLDIVFSHMKPKQILTWGLSDRHTWLADPKWNSHNPLGLSVRPLPLDQKCRRKLLWKSLYQHIADI